jgi:TetR/AcrR family transcriptional regulator, transcriptional repressor of aconitase
MQDSFTEAGLSAGAVYCHFDGKDEIIMAIADEVIDTVTATLEVHDANSDLASIEDALTQLFDTLQRAAIAAIAVTVWAEAVRDPALRRRLSSRYRRMTRTLTARIAAEQDRGAVDPTTDARHIAQVLTALGPAFLHQRALDTTVNASSFAAGVRALLRTSQVHDVVGRRRG